MSNNFRRFLSLFLAVLMAVSTITAASASSTQPQSVVGPDNYTTLKITTDKSSYSWGDIITFNVVVTNTSDTDLEYVSVLSDARWVTWFYSEENTDPVIIEYLPVGESKTVQIKYSADKLPLLTRMFLLPIMLFFGSAWTMIYKNTDYNYEANVKVNGLNYKFGFVSKYGYENTPTGKEVNKIKELNGGELPDIYMDTDNDIPSFIDGQYSDDRIYDYGDAIESLNDIKNLMKMDDPEEEFESYQTDTNNGKTFYRLQQMYKDIPVYGRNVIVSVDSDKNATEFSSGYEPGLEVSLDVRKTESDAILIVKNKLDSFDSVSSQGKVIYLGQSAPVLAWQILAEGTLDGEMFVGYIFVSANDGNVCGTESLLLTESVAASDTISGTTYSFNAWKENNSSYLMYDIGRSVVAIDLDGEVADTSTLADEVYRSTIEDENGRSHSAVQTTNKNSWDNRAVQINSFLIRAYDYYYNRYGRASYDGNDSPILLGIDSKFRRSNGTIYGENAYSDSHYGDHTDIVYGIDYAPALDVVVHEYTHSVESTISSMKYSGESGALMEAYSDIMGEVIEQDTTWMHFTNRNLRSPLSMSYPEFYQGRKWKDTNDISKNNDYGGVHTNCTVISHAAYLMQSRQITSMDELGELWYRSMYYLDRNSSFDDCRAAVIAAGRDMRMSNAKIDCIKEAFEAVGVKGTYLGLFGFGKISGRVASAGAGSIPIVGAQVAALRTSPNDWGAGVVETNSDGAFEITGLSAGTYKISVSAPGYIPRIVYDIAVKNFETTYIDNSILLETSNIDVGAIGGRITNALTNAAVSDATIRFRVNHGVISGEYYKKNGSVVTVHTDSDGRYKYEGITTGYYTMEIVKDGFVTGYFNVLASPSNDICMNQNYSITPALPEGQYRIVLTWGENPRDLDSHITGPRSDGSQFHVYYSDKDAYDGNAHVANLDVDDTTSYGPETVTLSPSTTGTYRYFIHRYAGSGSISTSGAQIKLYKGSSLIETYNAPIDQGTGDYWTVFEINNGAIKNINKIGDDVFSSTSIVPKAASNFIAEYNMSPKIAS